MTTLEAANTELKGLQKAAIAQIHQLGVQEYEARIAALRTELEAQRKRNDEISQLAWQRERWAEEHVENERRVFAESLRAAQLDFSRQLRDSTQSMLEARSRLVAVEDRCQAIRHVLAYRAISNWKRLALINVMRTWKELMARGRFSRQENGHQLQLRHKVRSFARRVSGVPGAANSGEKLLMAHHPRPMTSQLAAGFSPACPTCPVSAPVVRHVPRLSAPHRSLPFMVGGGRDSWGAAGPRGAAQPATR